MGNGTARKVLLPFGALGILVVLTATAAACTAWVGQFSVTGDRSDSGTVTSDGQGTLSNFVMRQSLNSEVARVSETDGSAVFSTDVGSNGEKLPQDDYNIIFYNNTVATQPGYTGSAGSVSSSEDREWNVDCMTETTDPRSATSWGEQVGEVSVDSNGEISGVNSSQYGHSYDASTNEATMDLEGGDGLNTNQDGVNESSFCIADDSFLYGNQVPLTVL